MPLVDLTQSAESTLCLTPFSVIPSQKAFLKNSIQSLHPHSKPNNIVLLPLVGNGLLAAANFQGDKTSAQKSWEGLTFERFAVPPRAAWEAHRCICWHPCIPGKKRRKKAKSKQCSQWAKTHSENELSENTTKTVNTQMQSSIANVWRDGVFPALCCHSVKIYNFSKAALNKFSLSISCVRACVRACVTPGALLSSF